MKLKEAVSLTDYRYYLAVIGGLQVGKNLAEAVQHDMRPESVAAAIVPGIVGLGAIKGGRTVCRIAKEMLKKVNTP